MQNKLSKQKGMSLLEILMAIIILGTAIIYAAPVFYKIFFVMRKGVDKTTASTVAYNVLNRYTAFNDFDNLQKIPDTPYAASFNPNITQINKTEYIYSVDPISLDADTQKINIIVKWWVDEKKLPQNIKMVKFSTIEFRPK